MYRCLLPLINMQALISLLVCTHCTQNIGIVFRVFVLFKLSETLTSATYLKLPSEFVQNALNANSHLIWT